MDTFTIDRLALIRCEEARRGVRTHPAGPYGPLEEPGLAAGLRRFYTVWLPAVADRLATRAVAALKRAPAAPATSQPAPLYRREPKAM